MPLEDNDNFSTMFDNTNFYYYWQEMMKPQQQKVESQGISNPLFNLSASKGGSVASTLGVPDEYSVDPTYLDDESGTPVDRDWVANPPTLEELTTMSAADIAYAFMGHGIEDFDRRVFEEMYGGTKPMYNVAKQDVLFKSTETAQEELRGQSYGQFQGGKSGFMFSGREKSEVEEARDKYYNRNLDLLLNRETKYQSILDTYNREVQNWLMGLMREDVFTEEYWGDVMSGLSPDEITDMMNEQWDNGTYWGEQKEDEYGWQWIWNGERWYRNEESNPRGDGPRG